MPARSFRLRALGALLAVLLVLTGCTPGPRNPVPNPTGSSAAARDFTVGVTERITTTDPVAVVDSMSETAVQATFQRLLTADAGKTALRPDAASDCLFTAPLVYECTLKDKLTFDNGNRLTTSDVRFSINRALRLGVAGSSARQLAALDHMEIVDDLKIKFFLSWADGQFGYALASPAASIVDEETYDPDAIRPLAMPTIGSGPMWITAQFDTRTLFRRNTTYNGDAAAAIDFLVLQYFADSAALEEAMKAGAVDVVWRGLSASALKRFDDQINASKDKLTDAGYRRETLTGVRIHYLSWTATSPYRLDASLRTAVSGALQEDRTLDSIVPRGVEGHVGVFALGGSPTATPRPGERPRLTLTYTSSITGERELARDIRDRLEAVGVASVQVVADSTTADLTLVNFRPWTSTVFAYLQPYRESPVPTSAQKVADLEKAARTTTDPTLRDAALAEIQIQAAADASVLPISQADDDVFLASTARMRDPKYGPGWQLGLWSLGKA